MKGEKKMKKQSLIALLVILMLLALGTGAYAEYDNGDVTAAATSNSIELVSIDEDGRYDLLSYTICLNITQELAQQNYFLGIQYSNDPNFQRGNGTYIDYDSDPTRLDRPCDMEEMEITRTSVNLIPNVQYYLRPVLHDNNGDVVDIGDPLPFDGPSNDSQFYPMNLNEEYYARYGWLHGKFIAPADGMYALTGESALDFISYVRPGYTEADSVTNKDANNPLVLFFHADQGETVYVFGTVPNDTNSDDIIKIVPAAGVAPTENSIEVGAPAEVSNFDAKFNFTVSTTAETAQNGYQVGIIYGDHDTDPANWQGRVKYRPEYSIKNSTTKRYGQAGSFVPGMDVDYQAALFDLQTGAILARGSYIGHLQTQNNFDNMTQLTKSTPYSWSDQGMEMFYFTAPSDGMYAVQGTGMNPLRLTDRTNRDLGAGNLLGSYLKKDEVFFPVAYNNAGNNCTIEVKDGLSTFRSVQINDGSSQVLNETTPVWFQAPEAGIYRFAIDENSLVDLLMVNKDGNWQGMGKEFEVPLENGQILWLRRTFGEVSNLALTVQKTGDYITSDLNLSDRGTYHITQNTIVAEGVNLSYWGTELIIDPGVTLTIKGNANGDAVYNSGTLRIEGNSAMFRSGSRMQLSGSGKVVVDGHGYVEFASDSIANNQYLNPNMNIEFANENEGSVTFGYFTPDEATMRTLNASVNIDNPQIRHDLQLYSYSGSDFTLTDNLTLREHVTLHTDINWGNGGAFVIPAGKTLTIPEGGGFYAFSSAINIQGSLVNNGEICLGAVGNSPISNMTLAEGGNYSGTGTVTIETLDNPLTYLSGFTGYRTNEIWRDANINRVAYRLIKVLNYRAEDGMGSYTLPGSLTINPDEQLLADTLTIPSGVTLTVNGSAYVFNALVINEGGALIIGDGARFELYNMKAPPTDTVVNGTITLDNNAGLYLGLGHWTNTGIKNTITVAGQDALIQVDYHHSGEGPKTVNEMLNVITGADAAVPTELEPFVRKVFSLCIPYEATTGLTIPEGIQFRVLNNGSDETGSLTIPQGASLTIPNGITLELGGANLTVNGTVDNRGRIELRTYRGGPDGTMPFFTMGNGATYQGNGQIWVRSYQNDPVQYLLGFDENKLSMYNRDDMGGQFRYVDEEAVIAAFRTACNSANPPEHYDGLQNLGFLTISESLVVPAGMQVDAWGTTFAIPNAVTLTVKGGFSCEGLNIAAGGALRVESLDDSSWAHVDTNRIVGSGAIYLSDRTDFNLDVNGLNASEPENIDWSGSGRVLLHAHAHDAEQYEAGKAAFQNAFQRISTIGMPAEARMNIYYPCVLNDGDVINGLLAYQVHEDGRDNHGSLIVPSDSTVTMTQSAYVILHGGSIQVYGTLVNNGYLEFVEAEYEGGVAGSLDIKEGGNYQGNGTICVSASENPKNHITGIDERRILTVWEEGDNHRYAYRIAETIPTTITNGSIVSFRTTDEGIFPDQYSGGILVTPQDSGYYFFTLSFGENKTVDWNEAWLGISGTEIQDQSFDTDEPDSLTFGAMLKNGAGYEIVLTNNSSLGELNVTVSIATVSGFANILAEMGSNPYQFYDLDVTTDDLQGLTTLTVPFNVALNVNSDVTLPSGLTVTCYGDIRVNPNGALQIPSGARLDLVSNGDWQRQSYGCVILNGGTVDAAANTMSFEGRSCVQLQNRNYTSNEAAVNAVSGVAISDIALEVGILNQSDYDYWYALMANGYREANLILTNDFELSLTQDLPEGYCLVVNEGSSVTVPEEASVTLYGYLAMEGGSFINNGTFTVDDDCGINIWKPYSTVQNNGTLQLYGDLRCGEEGQVYNQGSFLVMNQKHLPTEISFYNNPYHYPEEHCLVLPASVNTVETEAFANTAAWEIDLPDTIGSIADGAFADSDDLYLVVIPQLNVSITGNPFLNCPNVTIAAPYGGSVETFAQSAGIPFVRLG